MAKPFFIVFSPDGPGSPTRPHETHAAAFHEAHRLAGLHPGQTFHVMRSASRPVREEAAHD